MTWEIDDIIDGLADIILYYPELEDNEKRTLNYAITALAKDKWTPVTDGLPETDGDYLVVTENDRGTRRRQVSSFTKYDDISYTWGIETSPIYTVKAWMPLPEIWEDEK